MRLFFVVHGFPPDQPGVWTAHHVRELAPRHDICVFVLATDPAREHFEQWQTFDQGALVWRLNNLRVDHLRGFANPQIDDMFDYALGYFSPDIVHYEHVIGLSATLLTRAHGRGIPSVLALYDYYWVCPRVNLVRGDHSLCDGPSHAFDCVTCMDGPGIPPPADRVLAGATSNGRGVALPRRVALSRTALARRIRPVANRGGGDDLVAPQPWWHHLHDYRLNAMRALIEYPDVITACSDSLRDDMTRLLGLPAGRIRTVSLGVPPLPAPAEHTPHERVRVRYLGVIAPHKGLHVLARAATELAGLPVEFHLHGTAEPPYLASVLAEHPAIVHHGPYGRADLAGILGETDVLVLPTLSRETFSFVIREAALARVPVVASHLGSIPDFIRDGENGLLVPPGSVADLAAALRRLAGDPGLRSRLGGSAPTIRSIGDYSAEMVGIYAELHRGAQESGA
ncbi:MAG TPA: glycosyltransferase [Thermomicrobiales bacterium]|nr:glycosyltransferase [Thermomicrobiales bacterium]